MNKYRNRKTTVDGIVFDSRKEAERYQELRLLEKAREIKDLRLQVPFILAAAGNGERAVKYIADFVYFRKDGKMIVEDAKGYRTKDYIVKRKWFKTKYCSADVLFCEV